MNRNVKIVADSSANLFDLEGIPFEAAPLKIITEAAEYVDDVSLDVLDMVNALQQYKGKSSTSCPNAADWLEAFGEAEEVFCVTITATLSGSYNAALMAKEAYEEQHPDRRVFVLNSLSTGPEMVLVIEKLQEEIAAGTPFEEICDIVTAYIQNTGLLFVLESMKNLANNGRVSPLIAKVAGLLGVRVVGKASDRGDLEPLSKCRGEGRALESVVRHLGELGLQNGKVRIAHCFNEQAAAALKRSINATFPAAQVQVDVCGGLCSFYAEKGGLLVGFEKQ